MLIAIVHVISWLPRYIIYEPLANARMKGFKTWDDDEAKRFSQTATSLLFFCSSAVFATRILGPEEWIYSPSSWSFMSNITYVSPSFKFYTLWYISRFSSDLISIFFEKRKKVCIRIRITWWSLPNVFSVSQLLFHVLKGCIYRIIHSPRHHYFASLCFRYVT